VRTILISQFVLARYGDRIREIANENDLRLECITLPEGRDERLEVEVAQRANAAFFSPDLFPDHSAKFFAAAFKAQDLRWVHMFNTGTDHPIFGALREKGAVLTNYPGAQGPYIAQTAVAGILMLARGFPHWMAAQRRREWAPISRTQLPEDLEGQTLMLVGTGAIGSEIARLMRPFGVRIVGFRRRSHDAIDPFDEFHPMESLDEMLPRADWLVLACPLTDETRSLVDARRLGLLRQGARLVNVGRGELIVQAALEAALQSGALGGAYLDVVDPEPLPETSPLWSLPNVILTPHDSAAAARLGHRQVEGFLENLERWAKGTPLLHVIE
jgi:phosphoglycerate dehydrogenase-like enzyme